MRFCLAHLIPLSRMVLWMSNISGDEGSFSTANTGEEVHQENKLQQPLNHPHGSSSGVRNSNSSTNQQQQQANKKNRNLPGTPGKFFINSLMVV
ncbi:hypothetical protein JHK87_004083 [Glycine soja]|nr:hypothetical protein JHK87_004083 [Glycine soja]